MRGTILTAMLVACATSACGRNSPEYGESYLLAIGGNPGRGRQVIVDVGCGACHTIPGIREAKGLIGPPLLWWSRRTYIAGELPNTPDNLVKWVRSPRSIEAHTAMPALGLSEQQARDVAAYLYTLK